ncbi:hypothetical protein PIB30_074979 [Stylosanthes scabra]|uniref:At2g35280-like TPR domain-containing protein n=1 Tax=Stylosanthes scabra TaxID=79078 RepID=A0ABU6VN93_9FABA|nr:hypothetical protein [Stylosanthes scabra]
MEFESQLHSDNVLHKQSSKTMLFTGQIIPSSHRKTLTTSDAYGSDLAPKMGSQGRLVTLPPDVWAKIASDVAHSSVRDLCSMRCASMEFLDIGAAKIVFTRTAVVDEWRRAWLSDAGREYAARFHERCKQCGNHELLYRDGMRHAFLDDNTDAAINTLLKPAREGHIVAAYIYCMLVLLGDKGGRERAEAIEMFSVLERSPMLAACRSTVKRHGDYMWIAGRCIPWMEPKREVCSSASCPTRGKIRRIHKEAHINGGFDCDNIDGAGRDVQCGLYHADYEIIMFVDLFDFWK